MILDDGLNSKKLQNIKEVETMRMWLLFNRRTGIRQIGRVRENVILQLSNMLHKSQTLYNLD